MSWVESEIWQTWWFSRLPTSHVRLQAAIKCRVTLSAPVANIQNIKKEAGNSPGYQWDARVFQCLSNSQQLFHHVFGVDAVKGPCAVFIFLFFCVLVVFVFVGWVWGVGGMLTFSCTSTHTSCYAAARPLALPHIRHATSENSFLCWWLQSLERSLQSTSARKTPQMAKLCPQPRWVCEALVRKPTKKSSSLAGTQTLDRQWDWLKTQFPGSCIHIKTADKTFKKIGKSLAQERQWQCPEQPRTTFWCLKRKKELFGEALDEQNSCFVLVKH